ASAAAPTARQQQHERDDRRRAHRRGDDRGTGDPSPNRPHAWIIGHSPVRLTHMFPVNVPNVLTLLRILLVPVLVVALLDQTPNGDLLAAIVFAVASLTDAIDGYLARSRRWVTNFGKLMDPIADKLLIIAALIALVSLGRLEAWVAMVIIPRGLAVPGLRVAVGAGQGV